MLEEDTWTATDQSVILFSGLGKHVLQCISIPHLFESVTRLTLQLSLSIQFLFSLFVLVAFFFNQFHTTQCATLSLLVPWHLYILIASVSHDTLSFAHYGFVVSSSEPTLSLPWILLYLFWNTLEWTQPAPQWSATANFIIWKLVLPFAFLNKNYSCFKCITKY